MALNIGNFGNLVQNWLSVPRKNDFSVIISKKAV